MKTLLIVSVALLVQFCGTNQTHSTSQMITTDHAENTQLFHVRDGKIFRSECTAPATVSNCYRDTATVDYSRFQSALMELTGITKDHRVFAHLESNIIYAYDSNLDLWREYRPIVAQFTEAFDMANH